MDFITGFICGFILAGLPTGIISAIVWMNKKGSNGVGGAIASFFICIITGSLLGLLGAVPVCLISIGMAMKSE